MRNWGRGLRADGPYPLPQTPTPNPIYRKLKGDPLGRPF